MTVHSTFMAAVHSWIVATTGFNAQNVFRAQQNGPERPPGTNWATFNFLSGDSRDYPIEKVEDNSPITAPMMTAKRTRIRPGTVMVSVNMYHPEGPDKLRELDDSKAERVTRQIFTPAGAVLIGVGQIRNLTALNETVWVPRFQADFTFNIHHTRVELIPVVHISDLNGELVNDKMEIEAVKILVERNDVPQ
jgi:hypothetical protein